MARRLFLLDRDGVIVVNRRDNIRRPEQLELIPGAVEAIRLLNQAGYAVAICTNQPEVGRGAVTREELDRVHDGLRGALERGGARVDAIYACTSVAKSPRRKPCPGMVLEALADHDSVAAETTFVGDQVDDLKAAFHAGCLPVLVTTGLGRKSLVQGLPAYLKRVEVFDDLMDAVRHELARTGQDLAAEPSENPAIVDGLALPTGKAA